MKLAYNVPELVANTGMTRSQVYRLLESGQLVGRKVGTRWIVPVANVETFLADPSHARTAATAHPGARHA